MNSERDDKKTVNYHNIKKCVSVVCARFLRCLLLHFFSTYSQLKDAIPTNCFKSKNVSGFISQKNEHIICNEESISSNFKFPLLYHIFRSGACDELMCGPRVGWHSTEKPAACDKGVGDDILRLGQIWEDYLDDDDDDEIPDDTSQDLWNILLHVSHRMAETYKGFGDSFKQEIRKERGNKCT
jgi:hypothetical protein